MAEAVYKMALGPGSGPGPGRDGGSGMANSVKSSGSNSGSGSGVLDDALIISTDNSSTQEKIKTWFITFCKSQLGVAVLSALFWFVLIISIQPSWCMTDPYADGAYRKPTLNVTMAIIASVILGGIVFGATFLLG
jgi:hypothetical protein